MVNAEDQSVDHELFGEFADGATVPIANFDYPLQATGLLDLGYIFRQSTSIMYQNPTSGGSPIDSTAGYNISASVEYDSTTGAANGIVLVESELSRIFITRISRSPGAG